jgi:hypothetical protein
MKAQSNGTASPFLSLVPDGDELSASLPDRFAPWEEPSVPIV